MNMTVRIKENVIRLDVPRYGVIASMCQKGVIDEGKRGESVETGVSKSYLWMMRCS